ncbi:hypothetical protein DW355_13195 [Hylemonella gracilis]|uniref:Uncharacterized protein n=1 Tax=Hylemonella gracilis TaxID=80880 RepID=A0A4P6ULW9_9BURK|nr:hypothetical protein [Hylemonella gracilis]QBK05564.1 hypothetical protein DW355_13195 [Hylemonella gracilis]
MAVSSVNANSINTAAYVAPQQDNAARQTEEVESAQTQAAETNRQPPQQSAPEPQESRPAVNTQGQTTGRLVNETA